MIDVEQVRGGTGWQDPEDWAVVSSQGDWAANHQAWHGNGSSFQRQLPQTPVSCGCKVWGFCSNLNFPDCHGSRLRPCTSAPTLPPSPPWCHLVPKFYHYLLVNERETILKQFSYFSSFNWNQSLLLFQSEGKAGPRAMMEKFTCPGSRSKNLSLILPTASCRREDGLDFPRLMGKGFRPSSSYMLPSYTPCWHGEPSFWLQHIPFVQYRESESQRHPFVVVCHATHHTQQARIKDTCVWPSSAALWCKLSNSVSSFNSSALESIANISVAL